MLAFSVYIYISSFLISCIAAWQYSLVDDKVIHKKRSSKCILKKGDDLKFFYLFFIILPPVLIATFRGLNVGTDTSSYLYAYNTNKVYNLIEYLKIYGKSGHDYEIGYQQILHFSYISKGGYNLVKFLSEFLIVFFAWRGTVYYHRKFNIHTGFCLLFVYLLEYSYGLNGTRFAIGLSIFFYGFQFVIEKKAIKYFVTCFFCFLFHTTLLLTILFYFINIFEMKIFKKYLKIMILSFILLLSFSLNKILSIILPIILIYSVKYGNYLVEKNVTYGMGIYVIFLFFLIPQIRWDSFIKKDKKWLIILIATIIFIPFRYLGYINQWFGRLSKMPEILFSVLYCGIPRLKLSYNEKLAWFLYTLILIFGHYIISFIIVGNGEVYPYVLDFTNYI